MRLYYVTQPQVRPPTFVVSVSHVDGITVPYRRYLANRIRERFRFEGSPLRLAFRRHREAREASKGRGQRSRRR